MKFKFNYHKLEKKIYSKHCVKCGCKFKTRAKNKIYCDGCLGEVIREQTNRRVQKYNRKYRHKLNGTGKYLNGRKCVDDIYELENILKEMRHCGLL